jgi:hypothetical protein
MGGVTEADVGFPTDGFGLKAFEGRHIRMLLLTV